MRKQEKHEIYLSALNEGAKKYKVNFPIYKEETHRQVPKVDHLEVVERGDSRRYANQLVVVYLPSYCDHHDLLSDLDQHN